MTALTNSGIHYPIVYKLDQGQLKVSLTFINITDDSSLEEIIPLCSKLDLRYIILIMQIRLEYNRTFIDYLQVVQLNFAIRVSFLQSLQNGMYCLYLFSYFYILQAMSSRNVIYSVLKFPLFLETCGEMTSVVTG